MAVPRMKYTITEVGGHKTISISYKDDVHAANDMHESWNEIVRLAKAKDPRAIDLINPSDAISAGFQRLSERLTIRNRSVYWDGDKVDNSLSRLILRFVREGLPFEPLVKFFEKIKLNPNENSQQELFEWLRSREFTITHDGDIVGFKGYRSSMVGEMEIFTSTHAGHAFVNDEEFTNEPIPCKVGDIVTMPRSEVVHNPAADCSAGLHVGTPNYARQFGNIRVAVLINPRDVVSVPRIEAQKMRVCRYYVLGKSTDDPVSALLKDAPKWDPEKPVAPEVLQKQDEAGLGEVPAEQPVSEVLRDEKPKKVVPQAAKDTLAERRGVMTPEEKKEKKRQADRDRRAKKKAETEAPPAPYAGGLGIKHEGGRGYDWTQPHNMELIRAATTDEELQAAFPGLSLSRLKHLKRAFSK